jgi:hypothetical protein
MSLNVKNNFLFFFIPARLREINLRNSKRFIGWENLFHQKSCQNLKFFLNILRHTKHAVGMPHDLVTFQCLIFDKSTIPFLREMIGWRRVIMPSISFVAI